MHGKPSQTSHELPFQASLTLIVSGRKKKEGRDWRGKLLDHAKTLKDKSTTLQCNCFVLTEPALVNETTDCLTKKP